MLDWTRLLYRADRLKRKLPKTLEQLAAENITKLPKTLEQLAAENITKQTLLQSPAGDIVELLEHQKLQELLEYVARTKTSMVLAALPEAESATWWIKNLDEWFYRTYKSPFRLKWNLYDGPRSIHMYFEHVAALSTSEVNSIIVPMLKKKYNVKDGAINAFCLAAADYFHREPTSGSIRWLEHSNMLGHRAG